MTLLLVGIVAVILVILVAAFLTFRRGQDDDQDEPGGRWTVRDRVRSAGRDGHWRSSARERRPAEELRAPRRPGHPEPSRRPDDRQRGYDSAESAYADRRPGRGQRDQGGDRGYPARPAGRYADAPAAADYPAPRTSRTPPAAPPARGPGARRQPNGYDTGGYDNAGYDTAQYGTGPGGQLYDTGPSAVMDDDQSLPDEHDFTPERDDDPALTDSDVFPRIRGNIPPETSRKAAKPHTPAKSRSKQSRSKRGDDDDWPSTEWDKLSDEQYWAELSADKPLATTARAAQPVAAKAAPAPSTPPQAKPAQARPTAAKPSRPAPPPPAPPAPAQAKPTPDRASVAPRRRDRQQEAATEALPVRGRQRPAPAPAPSLPREAGEPSLAMLTSLANAPAARRPEPAPRDDDPLTSPSFSRQGAPAQDSRSYRSGGRDRPRGSTGDYPTGDYPTGDYPTGDYPTGGHPSGGHPSGGHPSGGHPSGGHPSGGYANGGYNNGGYPNAGYSNGSGAQGYQASDGEHTNPQAAYPAAWPSEQRPAPRPAAPRAPRPAAPSAPSRAPAGNPYGSYVDSAPTAHTGDPAAGYPQDRTRADVGYGGYPPAASGGYPEPPIRQPAGSDPAMAGLPGHSDGWHSAPPPAAADFPTDPASQYLYTGGSGYPDAAGYAAGLPSADASYQAGYPQPTGYPEPAGDPDGAHNGVGYPDGYGTDPYGPDGYGGYRPRQA